jgi:hypothetical protein
MAKAKITARVGYLGVVYNAGDEFEGTAADVANLVGSGVAEAAAAAAPAKVEVPAKDRMVRSSDRQTRTRKG